MSKAARENSEISSTSPRNAGRRAAGEDPRKREQIIEGAKRVFMAQGYDAASMNDITREAGVSKGTIYVYFDNKEELFSALIEHERSKLFSSIRNVLAEPGSVSETLTRFGRYFARHMTGSETMRALRTLVGVVDRMPQLASRFFVMTEDNPRAIMRAYLAARVAEGELAIEDTDLAARQFIDVATSGFFKHCMLAGPNYRAEEAEIDRVVDGAVDMFLARYSKR